MNYQVINISEFLHGPIIIFQKPKLCVVEILFFLFLYYDVIFVMKSLDQGFASEMKNETAQ